MNRRTLDLVPLGPPFPEAELVVWLARELERHCLLTTRIAEPHTLPSAPAEADADAILDSLIELRPSGGERPLVEWTLGLAAADLHASGHGCVFGEATVGGAWAVVSTAPLLPDDPFLDHELLRERLLKEALHELGHVAGLVHCRAGCMMTPASSPADVDARSLSFCSNCRARLITLDPPLVGR